MNDGTLCIVAYHYVRELTGSAFPRIKAVVPTDFEGQLDYIAKRYTIIDSDMLIAAAKARDPRLLPECPAYLTFDDGLADHYQTVLPILQRRGMHGAFFAPAQAVQDRVVAQVHKIQFILAASEDIEALAKRVLAMIAPLRARYAIEGDEVYIGRYYRPGRFDPPAAFFVKRMLQTGLPEAAASHVVHHLFQESVTQDETSFADTLYCRPEQLREMIAAGMYVGGHGATHRPLAHVDSTGQEMEIAATLRLLQAVGTATKDWIMCHPHGSYDQGLLGKLRANGCAVGLAVETGLARIDGDDPLALPRLDTNHLPHHADASPTVWAAAQQALS